MADEIQNIFNAVYADGPSDSPNHPEKWRIRGQIAPIIQAQIDDAKSTAQASAQGYRVAGSWAQLAGTPGSIAGQPGRVASTDAGSHTDPVVGGTVPNGGEYRWSGSAWQRMGDVIDAGLVSRKADKTALAATNVFVDERTKWLEYDAAGVIGGNRFLSGVVGGGTWYGFSLGITPREDCVPAQFRIIALPDVSATRLSIQIFRRPLETGDGTSPGIIMFGQHVDDVEVYPLTVHALATLGLSAGVLGEAVFEIDATVLPSMQTQFIYGVVIHALDEASTVVPLTVGLSANIASEPQWPRGLFRLASGQWQAMGSTSAIAGTFTREVSNTVANISMDIDSLKEGRRVISRQLGSQYSGSMQSANTFRGFAFGFNPLERAFGLKARLRMSVGDGTAFVHLLIYRRPVAVGDGADPGIIMFGQHAQDVLIEQQLRPLASLGLASGVASDVEFDLSSLGEFSPDYIYGLVWQAKSATGAMTFIAVGSGPSYAVKEPDYRRGLYTIDGANWSAFAGAYASMNCVIFYDRVDDVAAVVETPVSSISTSVDRRPSLTVTVPRISVSRASGKLEIHSQQITLDAVASDSASGSITLTNGDGSYLPTFHQYFGAVAVTRTSDGMPLTEGVDYRARRELGRLVRLSGAANFAVSVFYTGYRHRYDLIYADPSAGSVYVQKGTDRIVDPEAYKPAIPNNCIPLFWAYIWTGGVDLIPIFKSRGQVLVDQRISDLELLERNRRSLRNTMARLFKAQSVVIAGYGDSTTAMGNATTLTPGGTLRDNVSFFSNNRLPADTLAALEKFDADGTPNNSSGLYTHRGWNWYLKAAMERYGSAVSYLNFGIGGSRSDDQITNGIYGGLHPDRMAPLLSSGAHVVVVGFGLNELGYTTTAANVRSIVDQCKAAGMDVIIMSPPPIGEWNVNGLTYENWLYTHDVLWRIAAATDSAFISLAALLGPGNEANIGMSGKNMAAQNLINHPGITEYAAIGRFLERVIP